VPSENNIPIIHVAGTYRAMTPELIAKNISVTKSVAVVIDRLS
jgi:hypothetical protein